MNQQDGRSQSKVTLDQLLSLKKHEKPAPQFWESFNQQLHARSLQTLATRKRRLSLSTFWSTFSRALLSPAVPMAAAASLVLTIVMPSFINVADATFSVAPVSEQCSQTYFVHNCLNTSHSSQDQFASNSLGDDSMANFIARNVASSQGDVQFEQPYIL